MTDIERLRRQCFELLETNNVKATSNQGKLMIYSFWRGVAATMETPPPYVMICLSSGRYSDLILQSYPAKLKETQ
jgi:hypothetical protein